jgi:hypothetical protein
MTAKESIMHHPRIVTSCRNELRAVKYLNGPFIKVWEVLKSDHIMLRILDMRDEPATIDSLKSAGLWDKIEKNVRNDIENGVVRQKEEICEKMEDIRSKRKRNPVFAKMPDKLTCIKCGRESSYSKGAYCKRADDKQINVLDLVKDYVCQKCNPTKGRKAKPEFEGIPNKMKCACGYETNVPKRQYIEKSKKQGVKVSDLIKSYQCRKCKNGE